MSPEESNQIAVLQKVASGVQKAAQAAQSLLQRIKNLPTNISDKITLQRLLMNYLTGVNTGDITQLGVEIIKARRSSRLPP